MTSPEIIELEKILQLDESTKIVKQEVSLLTAPGENYGSIMLKVDLVVKTLEETREIHLVAKLPPVESSQEIFNTQITFRNEIAFYKDIIPLLQNFQKEQGVLEVDDFFAKCYGSRINLKGDDFKIDSNSCLLLENLKVAGYKNMDKMTGFDMDVATLVISSLAKFHAVPLAFRLQKPGVFEKEIVPHLSPWKMNVDYHNQTKKQVEKIVDSISELVPLKQRILSGFDKKLLRSQCREPFATIVHNDFWVNNVMIKLEGTKPIKSKIVDLQECTYASLAKDLLFFLFSSVNRQVLERHYEDLVQIYYQKFMSILVDLGCDIKTSFEEFENELAFEAEYSQFGHALFMLNPIFASGDLSEVTAKDLVNLEPSELHKEKFIFVVKEFAKRNWI